MPQLVSLKNVKKHYALGKIFVEALRGVDLSIDEGEFAAVAGPSGSGKTTLLNLIGCVDVPTAGTVTIDHEDVGGLNDKARTHLRLRKLGFIFQTFNLVQVLDVFQNVEFPLLLQNTLSIAERKSRVESIIERVGLTGQMKQRPNELSGGQRQRVAIARALVSRPKIVMADEPTANLDSATGGAIIDLMKDMNQQNRTTFIFSTHDPKVMQHASRLINLKDGRIADA